MLMCFTGGGTGNVLVVMSSAKNTDQSFFRRNNISFQLTELLKLVEKR